MRHELRFHGCMTDLTAELRGFHVMDGAVRRQRNDHEVDDGEQDERRDDLTLSSNPEIENRPIGRWRFGMFAPAPLLELDPDGNQQQADDERRGHGHEQQQSEVRTRDEAKGVEQE